MGARQGKQRIADAVDGPNLHVRSGRRQSFAHARNAGPKRTRRHFRIHEIKRAIKRRLGHDMPRAPQQTFEQSNLARGCNHKPATRCQDEDRDHLLPPPEPAHQFQPFAIRKAEIKQHQVIRGDRQRMLGPGHRFAPVDREADPHGSGSQNGHYPRPEAGALSMSVPTAARF
jgi:hypothetical protein